MTAKKNELGTKNIGKLLFDMAVPAIIAQIVNVLYNLVDRMYIGHLPEIGRDALTGVGVTLPLIMLITAFSSLVSMGGASRASIAMGKKDHESAERILGSCTVALIALSVVLTAVVLAFGKEILMAIGGSENTITYALDYMNIYAIGTIFVQLTLGLNAFITAQGFAKTSMATVTIGAIANIVLDPILMFGFDLGVAGAAWATIISQAVSSIWVLRFLLSKKSYLKIRKKHLTIDLKIFIPCVAWIIPIYHASYREYSNHYL